MTGSKSKGSAAALTPEASAKQSIEMGAFYALMCILAVRAAAPAMRVALIVDVVVALGFVVGALAFRRRLGWGRILLKYSAVAAMVMTVVNLAIGFPGSQKAIITHHYGLTVIVLGVIMTIAATFFQLVWCFTVHYQMKVSGGEAPPLK